jgi:hypothetical protein
MGMLGRNAFTFSKLKFLQDAPKSALTAALHCQIVTYGSLSPDRSSAITQAVSHRPGFAPGSFYIGLVTDKVVLGHVFSQVPQFSPVNVIPP